MVASSGADILRALAELFEIVRAADEAASAFAESLRWGPATFAFALASTWWVKWPLIALVGAAADALRRRVFPCATCAAACAVGVAALLVALLKEFFDRTRPSVAEPALNAIGVVPESASFPSGHAATAFAAAIAVGLIHPRLRWPLLALAALVGLSRVYLGMHYATDVAVGSVLGVALGLASVWLVRAVAPESTEFAASPVRRGTSFAPRRRSPG
jgi:undecaprenyl-diphosphatase